jgi:hypothetical protein
VLDTKGKVIGVATLKDARKDGIAFCIPAKDLSLAITENDLRTEADVARIQSRHRAFVVFHKLDTLNETYARLLFYCAEGFDCRPLEPVLSKAVSEANLKDIQDELTIVRSDRNLLPATRASLTACWTDYVTLSDHLHAPWKTAGYAYLANRFLATHNRIRRDTENALAREGDR